MKPVVSLWRSLACLAILVLLTSFVLGSAEGVDTPQKKPLSKEEYTRRFHKKLRNLRTMLDDSEDHVIRMTMEQFEEYHVQKPRPYTLVIYFYRNIPEHMEMLDSFKGAAKQWSKISPQYGKKAEGRRPIFFVAVRYRQDKTYYKLVEDLNFKPRKAILISDGREMGLEGENLAKYNEKRWWSVGESHHPTKRIMSFIADIVPPSVQYQDDPWEVLDGLWKFMLLTAIVGLVYIRLFPYVTHPSIWILAFFLIYYYSAGCFVWCSKKAANWTGIKDGETEYVFPAVSMQHIAEGHLIATMVLSVSAASLLVFYLNEKVNHWILRRVITAAFFYLIHYLLYHIEDFLKKKMIYEPTWEPREWAYRGPSIRNDQGHTL
jgi:OST3 / OST6 family, transporter family